jgi:photosystem II stability/assembly factor-like uncharacterized protein
VFTASVDSGVHRSSDGGRSWRQVLSGVAYSVAMHPDDPNQVYAGLEPANVMRTTDGGRHWSQFGDLKTLPESEHWTFPHPPHLAHVRALALALDRPDTVYAGIEVGGFVRTDDAGRHWVAVSEGLHPDIHGLALHPDGQHIYAATGDGFHRSANRGDSWERSSRGIDRQYARAVTTFMEQPEVLLLSGAPDPPSAWQRPGQARMGIYRSDNGGTHWSPVAKGLPDPLEGEVDRFAHHPGRPGRVWFGTGTGNVFESVDFGNSWGQIADGLGAVRAVTAVVMPGAERS